MCGRKDVCVGCWGGFGYLGVLVLVYGILVFVLCFWREGWRDVWRRGFVNC